MERDSCQVGMLCRIDSDDGAHKVQLYSDDQRWNIPATRDHFVGQYRFGELLVILAVSPRNSCLEDFTVKLLTSEGLVGWMYFNSYYRSTCRFTGAY